MLRCLPGASIFAILTAGAITGCLHGKLPVPAPSAGGNVVTVKDFEMDPPQLTVPVGTTVTWKFEGPTGHSTTADDASASIHWDSGVQVPGASFNVLFDKPGTYRYHCMPHPFMHGTIVVQ